MICHIAALSKNRAIGKDGDLPWHIPEDLKFFKEKTLNHCVIMGRKTFESLKKPLPNRTNVVVTKNPNWSAEGCEVFSSIDAALDFCKQKTPDKDIFIAGGGEIFKSTLNITDKLYLTLIDSEFEGDAFYPEWQEKFKLTEKRAGQHKDLTYHFCVFHRQ